ncbi:MAG: exosome complex RNA-binding protein Csl4 [Thermofilaceae archaeon]
MGEEGFAVPGDELGVIEEYMPAHNAYEFDGVVRAKAVGRVKLDAIKHEASVVEAKRLPLPKSGDAIHAIVAVVRDAVAYADIFYNETAKVFYPVPFRGIIHISEASNERLRSLHEVYGYGDILRARVLSRKPPYMLSTRGPEYGLLLTRCPKCLTPLKKRGLWLYCPTCRRTHKKRKISRYYALR